MSDLDPIVEQLRDERLRRNWSQEYVAARLSAPRQTVTAWESGTYHPTVRSVRRWATALGLDVVLVRREE